MKIKDSVALVTGANRGLGLALARALVSRGAKRVYAGARDVNSLRGEPGLTPVVLDVNDPASVIAASASCGDVNLIINNAGIARILPDSLDPSLIDLSLELFMTNYYGLVRVSQAFAPVLAAKGGAAVLNILSDQTWLARPQLAAYAASKSAAWAFTNALRADLRDRGVQVVGLHVGFIDTDMTQGLDVPKTGAAEVAAQALDGLESGAEEVLADAGTRDLKQSLSSNAPFYLRP